MTDHKIDIKKGTAFPWQFKLLAVLFIILSFAIIKDLPAVAAILAFLALLIFTGRSGIEIDLEKKHFKEYTSFFYVVRTGKPYIYDTIECLFINAGRVSQKIYTAHTLNSSTFTDQEYNLFIKFGNGEKIKLINSKDKKYILNRAKWLSDRLNTSVIDYTTEEA